MMRSIVVAHKTARGSRAILKDEDGLARRDLLSICDDVSAQQSTAMYVSKAMRTRLVILLLGIGLGLLAQRVFPPPASSNQIPHVGDRFRQNRIVPTDDLPTSDAAGAEREASTSGVRDPVGASAE